MHGMIFHAIFHAEESKDGIAHGRRSNSFALPRSQLKQT